MKRRTLFTCLLIIVISLSVFIFNVSEDSEILKAYFSSISFSDSFENNTTPLSTKNFDTLNNNEKKAYINIFNKIRSHPEYIRIPALTNKEFNNVFFAVKNDNPDILCFSDSCNLISFFNASFIQMNYINTSAECDNMMTELNNAADKIISNMKAVTDFEKELYIHDYVVLNCEYEEAGNSSSAYGCLIDKKAICSGYSRAAMILLNKAGIDTMVISGTGITAENEKISHMWNIVWINQEPYHLDVTWDDPVSESEEFISHLFFNLTNKQISVDHIDLSYNIQAKDENYNYFVYNGLLFYNFNKTTINLIAEKLCENIRNGTSYIEITFADDKSYAEAVEQLLNGKNADDAIFIIYAHLLNNVEDMIDASHFSFSKDDSKHYIRIMFDLN